MPRLYTVMMGFTIIGQREFNSVLNQGEYVVFDGNYYPVLETSRAHPEDCSELEYVVRLGNPLANAKP